MIRENQYNLIILDVMMTRMSGLDVIKVARKEGVQTPIIFLTAKGEEIDKVLGLELGADDYVTKPFSLRELLARVKAVLRRGETSINKDTSEAVIGKLTVHFTGYQAYEPARHPGGEGIPVQMSHREFEILHYLWKKRNQTVSRDELLNNIWGYDENPATRTVDNFIVKLRNKIENDPNHPQIILTVHGIGYKLVS